MPKYTLVGGPCDGQTVELDLEELERMNWLVDMPATQDVRMFIWGGYTEVSYSIPVIATYRLAGYANSVIMDFVSSRSSYTAQQESMRHVSMEGVWEIIQREMNPRRVSAAEILNPVFRRERVPVPATMADSINGIRRYEPGHVSMVWVDEPHPA